MQWNIPRIVVAATQSGGGKTTFLKMINGLVEPTSGEITVLGESLKTADLVQLRRKIGYAIQGSVLFPHLTVEENIAYVPNLWNKSDKARTKKAVAKWMAIVGLAAELGERYPAGLSGGQQQRVGIARALAASPELLLMDEPFSALDAITRESMQEVFLSLWQKHAVTTLLVTHYVEEALTLAGRIAVMRGTPGRVTELIDNPFGGDLSHRSSPEFFAMGQRLRAKIAGGGV